MLVNRPGGMVAKTDRIQATGDLHWSYIRGLQWGRDRSVAESARRNSLPDLQRQQASMGPRPIGRGIPADGGGVHVSYVMGLQWGRDRSVAESRVGCGRRRWGRRLQWGRD